MARRVLLAEVGERTLWDQTRFGGNNAGGASGQTIYFNSPNLEVAKNAYRFAGMLYPDVGNVFSITPRAGGRLLFAVRATTLQDNGAYIGVCTQAFGVDTVPGFNGSGSPDNESWSIHTGGFSAGAGASYHGGVSGGGAGAVPRPHEGFHRAAAAAAAAGRRRESSAGLRSRLGSGGGAARAEQRGGGGGGGSGSGSG